MSFIKASIADKRKVKESFNIYQPNIVVNLAAQSGVRYSIYNIGNGQPQNLMDFVHILSEELIRARVLDNYFDIEKHVKFIPMQPGDVSITYADSSDLEYDYGFKPGIDLRTGLRHFAEWYKNYCLV